MADQNKYTRSVEAELQLAPDGKLTLRFCDAQVSQWGEGFDSIADWDDDRQLESEIASEIENAAAELAASLVRDLRERVLATAEEGGHG